MTDAPDTPDLLGPIWRERVKQFGTPAEVAARIGVEPKTVASWTRETKIAVPQLKNLVAIAKTYQYPLIQQLADAGLAEQRLSPYAKVSTSESLALAASTLWHAVEELNTARPGPAELAREVLASCEQDGVPGRWRCRLFDVPSGWRYPHVAYRGVEFQLAPDAEGRLHEHWDQAEWNTRRVDPWTTLPTPWIERCVTSNGSHSPQPAFGWQRLELLYRLREKLPLVPGRWLGAVGRLHTTLLLRDQRQPRHLYLVPAYQERMPDSAHRVVPPYAAEFGINRILVIGPSALAPDSIARILAEGLAWHGTTGRELASRHSGRVRGYHDPERVPSLVRMYTYLAHCGSEAPYDIVGLHDLDTMLTSDATKLLPEVEAMLVASGTLTVLLWPTRRTLDSWRERQLDQKLPWTGVRNSWRDDPKSVFAYLETISSFLRRNVARGRKWPHLTVSTDLQWFNPERPVFESPDIGDYRIRAAYELAYRLKRRRPLTRGATRSSIPLAEGSLLQKKQVDLSVDPDVPVLENGTGVR
jgi:hypothetical protein